MRPRVTILVAALATCGSFAVPAAPAGAAVPLAYRTVQLGIQGTAEAINDRGQVAGQGVFEPGSFHPFLYTGGRFVDLGVLDGGRYESGDAADLNNRGQVVGSSIVTADQEENPAQHAFLRQRGRMTDLGTLGGRYSRASAINERGQVVGDSDTGTAAGVQAFLWQRGTLRRIAGMRSAADINDRGQILGYSELPRPGGIRAFIWERGRLIDLTPRGIPVYPNILGFNERAQIAGYRYGDPGTSAVVYR